MTEPTSVLPPLLPPPVATILLYAADGLAAEEGRLSRSGRPRTPERALWVPLFRKLIETAEGFATLRAFAYAGMQAWGCSSILLECLDAAFRDPSFQSVAIAALEDFAETARERFSLAPGPAAPAATVAAAASVSVAEPQPESTPASPPQTRRHQARSTQSRPAKVPRARLARLGLALD